MDYIRAHTNDEMETQNYHIRNRSAAKKTFQLVPVFEENIKP